jgi:hypothetical protein
LTLGLAARFVYDDAGIDLCPCSGLCLLAGLRAGHGLALHIRTAPVAMLAPPQAGRLGQAGGDLGKEAVNTDSNARFGREVEWNVSGTMIFS